MPKKHYVVIKGSNGNSEKHPLKAWLKEHPSEVPAGRDAFIDTSYQLRRALKKVGWELEELDDTVLLIKPDESGETDFADTLFDLHSLDENPSDESVIEEAEEITFDLNVICRMRCAGTSINLKQVFLSPTTVKSEKLKVVLSI
jgi:hypothetical protein